LVELAGRAHRYRLWPYLIEDTLSRREQFKPDQVERRRVSRALYRVAAALPLLALAVIIMLLPRPLKLVTSGGETEAMINLQDLQIRPADNGLGQNAEITGDPATMAKLAEKEAAAASGLPGEQSRLSKLLNQARDLAGNLQNKLTGRKPAPARIKLRLADELQDKQKQDEAGGNVPKMPKAADNGAAQFDQPQKAKRNRDYLPPFENSPRREGQAPDDSMAGGKSGDEGTAGKSKTDQDKSDADRLGQGDQQAGSGTLGAVGADPEHLFGDADQAPANADSFGIMINAHPSDRGSIRSDRPYVPPKVRASLSTKQYPDEPLARSLVPADERSVIKRIFER
jgi:hypothetical protein